MNKKKVLVSVLGILGIILATVGVTYAFFSYSKTGTRQNTITSGAITFHYKEGTRKIEINDVMPMTDADGKKQSNYFDFTITSKTSDLIDIPYYITVKRNGTGTNMDNIVKVYLTKVDDGEENEVSLAKISELGAYSNNNDITIPQTEKLLYRDKVMAGEDNYNQQYRLRMWIDSNAQFLVQEDGQSIYPYQGKTYSLTVNVYGNGEFINQTTKEYRENTRIDDIEVGNSILTSSNDTFIGNEMLPPGEESIEKTITVNTENPNSIVTVEKLNAFNNNSKIKRLSKNLTLNLNYGTNKFKITVKSENKKKIKQYNLVINVVYSSYDVTLLGNNITYSENPVIIPYNGMNTVSVTPESYYYLESVTCTNGYEIEAQTGLSATTTQTVTIKNNKNASNSTCEFTTAVTPIETPVISASVGYPIITQYGVAYGQSLNVTYDNRNDIDNYVSFDNGKTWELYTGKNVIRSLNVKAKSVKKNTNVESPIASTVVSAANESLDTIAFNGNQSDSITTPGYINVSSEMIGKKMFVKMYTSQNTWNIKFLNSSGSTISTFASSNNGTCTGGYKDCSAYITIPSNTSRIYFQISNSGKLYEIGVDNRPTFNTIKSGGYYPTLTSDGVISEPITINYFTTAVQKYYQLVNSGSSVNENAWIEYPNSSITFPPGKILYAKSVDQYGKSSYSNSIGLASDALESIAYNGNQSDYTSKAGYIKVSSEMIGKKMFAKMYTGQNTWSMVFLNSSGSTISSFASSNNGTCSGGYKDCSAYITIPSQTYWINFKINGRLYEISADN